jgi:hypothetical protein
MTEVKVQNDTTAGKFRFCNMYIVRNKICLN